MPFSLGFSGNYCRTQTEAGVCVCVCATQSGGWGWAWGWFTGHRTITLTGEPWCCWGDRGLRVDGGMLFCGALNVGFRG